MQLPSQGGGASDGYLARPVGIVIAVLVKHGVTVVPMNDNVQSGDMISIYRDDISDELIWDPMIGVKTIAHYARVFNIPIDEFYSNGEGKPTRH